MHYHRRPSSREEAFSRNNQRAGFGGDIDESRAMHSFIHSFHSGPDFSCPPSRIPEPGSVRKGPILMISFFEKDSGQRESIRRISEPSESRREEPVLVVYAFSYIFFSCAERIRMFVRSSMGTEPD